MSAVTNHFSAAHDFAGIHVPVVTCFDAQNKFNVSAQQQLIKFLLQQQQADGIVACATTGEGVLLSESEYWQVATTCLETTKQLNPKIKVTLGTSHFDPQITVARHQRAQAMGFDGVLVTHPPYIKPDQRGIKAFFHYLATAVPNFPIIIYNIWYRTGGKGINAETLVELAKLDEIVAVKDSGFTIEHLDYVLQRIDPKQFVYLCGEDLAYYDCLAYGGHGTISAAAHLVGKEMKQMLQAMQAEKIQHCLSIFRQIAPIIKLLFEEPNPGPIKVALAKYGIAAGDPRLPLLPITDQLKEKLFAALS